MNSPRRILVVDDEERDRSLLEAMLDSFGYSVELAGEGAEALDKLNSDIDLVLLDVMMPRMDGLEVARRIRNRADFGDIPIVMVTALSGKKERLQAAAAGANDFISKPIDRTELHVRLASLLKMKDARDALRRSEEKYRTLVETTKDVIWTVDLDLRYTYVSPSVTDALGYTVDEIMSMNPLDGFAPESRERVLRAFQEELALEAEGPRGRYASRTEEIERRHKDGSTRWAEITATFLRDDSGKPVGIMGTSRDLTKRKQMEEALRQARDDLEQRVKERTAELLRANEQLVQEVADRKNAEEALRESEAKYRFLAEHATDVIWTTDLNMRTTYASPSIEKILGFTPEERMRQSVEDQLTAESLDTARQRLLEELRAETEQGIRLGRSVALELDFLHKDGSVVCLESVMRFIRDETGIPVGLYGLSRDITERKRAEEALRESEERFRAFFEATFEAIFMTHKGFCLDQNLAAEKMFGYSTEEAVGRFGTEVISAEYRDLVINNMLSGYEEPYEAVALRKDGTTFPCEIQGKMFNYQGRSIRVTAIRDISERKTAEEALRKSEERFRSLIERAPLAVAFSRNLKFVYVNPEFLKMFGYLEPAELAGQPITDRVAPRDLSEFTERARGREDGLPADSKYEATGVRKDGSHFPVEAFVTRLNLSDGDVTAAFLVDITERKRAEEERESLRSQVSQAQKMEAVGTLAGGIAHDFNNLLTIMNGYTELILSEVPEDDPIVSDLRKVLETGLKGAELVQRLLAFGKNAEINPQPLDLNLTLENSIKLLERTFPKMIEIETRADKDLRMVNADAVQVQQVLMNLCINAKEAMPEGGRIRIELKNILVDEEYCRQYPGAKPGRHVLIEMSDSGAGMSKETMKRMFDPFFTTKGWDSRKGTGLGLSVTKGIVEQHGGWITCESQPGKGTTFRIGLPATEIPLEETEPERETAPVTGDNTILLVDDEAYVRDLATRILERSGYTVITAADGQEALEIYSRQGDNIALVILDLIMPHMSGRKCLDELLKLNPHIKVIVSTGFSLDPTEEVHFGTCAKGFVKKPYQMKQLLEVVRQVLDAV